MELNALRIVARDADRAERPWPPVQHAFRRWSNSTAQWRWPCIGGPAAGLAIVDALRDDKALRQYQWLPGGRRALLAKLGRREEARAGFEQAAALAGNQREKALLLERAARLGAT